MSKEEHITFRASKEEKELIRKKAKKAGMKMSDYIRTCSLGNHIIKTTVEEINE
jgi:uncharacterized protein (DUF1778 family)